MGLATTLGQLVFMFVFLLVLVSTFVSQERLSKSQSQQAELTLERVRELANTDFAIINASYNNGYLTVALQNNGVEIIDVEYMDLYLDSQKLNRTITQESFGYCISLPCGELGYGDYLFETTNLQLLYHFNNRSVDGDSSTTITDFSGNVNDATGFGTTYRFTAGKFGKAADFEYDATANTYIQSPSVSFDEALNYTWSFWIKPDSTQQYIPIIEQIANPNRGYKIAIDGGWPIFIRDDTSAFFNATQSIPANTWTNIVITYADQDVAFYVNGVQTNTGSAFRPRTASSEITIGAFTSETNYGTMNASIDEFAFYNKQLNASEVLTLYDKTREIKNPNIWDGNEFAEIDYTIAVSAGTHTLTAVSKQGVSATYAFEV